MREASLTRTWVLQDWRVNRGSAKFRALLILFRVAQLVRRRWGRGNPVAMLIALIYRVISEVMIGVEIPVSVRIGPGLRIYHGFGLVIHPAAVLGSQVTLRHGVTIGNQGSGDAPTIGDRVSLGVGASVLGNVSIGDDVNVGAHALVLRDVAPGLSVRAPEGIVKGRHR